MQFETVFDVTLVGYRYYWFPALGLIFVSLGAFFVFFPGLARRLFPVGPRGWWDRLLAWGFFVFSLIWTAGTLTTTLREYIDARGALASGHVTVTEGVVTDVLPMPYSGKAHESFVVGGQKFFYSDYVATSGFNQTRSHGGPLDNGVYVRITHRGNTILRLEIGR